MSDVEFRTARDEDSPAVIALVAAAYAEHPGCVLDVYGEEPELRVPATAFADWGGAFWVAVQGGQVVGCIGWRPLGDEGVELLKLYVAATVRGQGIARRLVAIVGTAARKRGATRIELWSDTRFTTAHRLYERLGFLRSPGTRQLDDLSRSIEYHFLRGL